MNKAEFEAIPITDKVMLGSDMVWDEFGERWWIGTIDGIPYRRRFGPQFSSATFRATKGGESAMVSIPFTGEYTDRVLRSATEWAAKHFNCSVESLDSVENVSP